jgi:hypothetical protein
LFARLRDTIVGFSLVATGQPGPEDVASCVHVGMIAVSAAGTSELGGVAALRIDMPTCVAGLGGVPRTHRDHVATSFFRFVADESQQLPPARSQDLTVQTGLGGGPVGIEPSFIVRVRLGAPHHVRDLQVFVDDDRVPVNELSGCMVGDVAALILDPPV